MHTRIHIYIQPSRTVLVIQDRPTATDAEADESKVDEVQASIWRGGPWATGMYIHAKELFAHVCVYAYVGLHVYFYVNVCIYSREERLVFFF